MKHHEHMIDAVTGKDGCVTVDGKLYARCYTAAEMLKVDKNRMREYAMRGMPYAKLVKGVGFLYPVEDCREWLKETGRGSKKTDRIFVDGKLYLSSSVLAAEVDCHPSNIYRWIKDGLPTRRINQWRMFPMLECIDWINKHRSRNVDIKVHSSGNQYSKKHTSLCNFCDNAYAFKCSWFTNYKPVPGWEAEEKVCICAGEEKPTYNVLKCPNFTPDKPRRIKVCQYHNKIQYSTVITRPNCYSERTGGVHSKCCRCAIVTEPQKDTSTDTSGSRKM